MPLKIVIAGPKGSGKSTFANFFANNRASLACEKYDPTYGLRILESEGAEIWDSSGDTQFEGCWRSTMSNADGVVLVYDPDSPGQDQLLNEWFELFVKKNGLKEDQCMIFAHRTRTGGDRFKPPYLFSRVTAAVTSAASGNDVKNMFQNFIKDIQGMKQRK